MSYETAEIVEEKAREGGKDKEFVEVPWHTDNSEKTFIVALSGEGEYRGGGTVIERLSKKTPVNLAQGSCLMFEGGDLRHRGEAITSGRRVLLVGFMELAEAGAARGGEGAF